MIIFVFGCLVLASVGAGLVFAASMFGDNAFGPVPADARAERPEVEEPPGGDDDPELPL